MDNLIDNENKRTVTNNKVINLNVKFHTEEERVAKGLLKVYDMTALHIKSKHPKLYNILLDIEAGVDENG